VFDDDTGFVDVPVIETVEFDAHEVRHESHWPATVPVDATPPKKRGSWRRYWIVGRIGVPCVWYINKRPPTTHCGPARTPWRTRFDARASNADSRSSTIGLPCVSIAICRRRFAIGGFGSRTGAFDARRTVDVSTRRH
jgi:hypothetical protein